MRKPEPSDSMLMCLFLNLLLHPVLGALAILLSVLHWAGIFPWLPAILVAILWVAQALVGTYLIRWGNRCSNQKDPPKENKNPYSTKTTQ